MTRAQLFPATLIVLDLGAAVAYGVEGDWRRAVYWLAPRVVEAAPAPATAWDYPRPLG